MKRKPRPRFHAARLDKSARLRSLLDCLGSGSWYSTLSLARWTHAVAVHTDIAELRANGIKVECRMRPGAVGRRIYEYRMVRA